MLLVKNGAQEIYIFHIVWHFYTMTSTTHKLEKKKKKEKKKEKKEEEKK